MRSFHFRIPCVALLVVAATQLFAADFSVQLNLQSAQSLPVGTPIQFQAVATPPDPAVAYRFTVRQGSEIAVLRDFEAGSNGLFSWVPMQEGAWDVEVTAKNPAGATAGSTVSYRAAALASTQPVVSSVAGNTMLAIYSVPPCNGAAVRVAFYPVSNPANITYTPSRACNGKSLSFLIAGMTAATPYALRHEAISTTGTTSSPLLNFTTGAKPSGIPGTTAAQAPSASTSSQDKVIFQEVLVPAACRATSLDGSLLWYYNAGANGSVHYCLRPVTGGTFLMLPSYPVPQTVLREVDLAGNLIRETNVARINEQLAAQNKPVITGIHHDASRLPNGHTAMVVSRERRVNGANWLGDGIVVVDRNFQVVWTWDSFEKIGTATANPPGDTCAFSLAPGCPPYSGTSPAVDWTHANSVTLSADGNLLLSIRHLDLVVKIRYANGSGNGDVLWKLGANGDLPLTNPSVAAYPFHSHPHDATQVGDRVILYDNGNTRLAQAAGNSRGQVYILNEEAKTSTLELNADLGLRALALGSAQRLTNGNYTFGSGPNTSTHTEFTPAPLPAGTLNYKATIPEMLYRSYRMQDMYTVSGSAGTNHTGLRFVPVTPCRLVDTRAAYAGTRSGSFGPPTLAAGSTRTIPIPSSTTCTVPPTAKAYVLNLTLDTFENQTGPVDFVTLWPAGETMPEHYTARTSTGGYIANAAIVKAGAAGAINVYASNAVNIAIDINGYFTDDIATPGLLYYPMAPCRAVDTRGPLYSSLPPPYGNQRMTAREARAFRLPGSPACQIPAAAAYSVQLTLAPGELTNGSPVAFITAYPTGVAQPNASIMNALSGYVVANSAIIPASANGSIDVFTQDPTNLIIDVNGYFAPDDGTGRGLYYFPTAQCRLMNTFDPSFGSPFGPPLMSAGVDRTLPVPTSRCTSLPATARAWALNASVVPNGVSVPYLSLWPSGSPWPNVSQLNAFQGQTLANSSIVPAAANGSIDIRVAGPTHVQLEVSGYFAK
ncbi:MAG: aryl-sulfate sulfotransferase [Acidobacteria bacterium]|nr:aryl-sulfate sulfotransferase [Acidobacteriota bacterium]